MFFIISRVLFIISECMVKVCEIPVTPPWTLAALMLGHEFLYFLCFLLNHPLAPK